MSDEMIPIYGTRVEVTSTMECSGMLPFILSKREEEADDDE